MRPTALDLDLQRAGRLVKGLFDILNLLCEAQGWLEQSVREQSVKYQSKTPPPSVMILQYDIVTEELRMLVMPKGLLFRAKTERPSPAPFQIAHIQHPILTASSVQNTSNFCSLQKTLRANQRK